MRESDETKRAQPGRARVGRILLGSALLMLTASALCAVGAISVRGLTRNILAGTLAVGGVIEALIGLRVLSES